MRTVNSPANGGIVDFVLGFMVVELIVLIIVRMKMHHGVQPRDLLVSMGAGAALLMALRGAIHGDVGQSLLFWLFIALLFHVWDLTRRWTTRRTP